MSKVIEIKNLSKIYDLGLVGTGTLSKDLNRTWAKLRNKPDPYATLVELNDRTQKSKSNIVYALKDINFSVDQGEVLGIIGKNGAGKSTLLKILSQITSPSTGIIKMKGRVASLLEVGTGMHPEMTARQNIYLNGSLMGMRRHEITSKLDEIVDFAGIEKYIDTPIKRFSSGMTVRLGFAIAAFLDPEILIVDEVLAVGDAEFQKKAIGKMQDVSQGEGRTVLFVSHNMESVKNLCSAGITLKNGSISFSGSSEEAVKNYLMENDSKNVITHKKYKNGNYPGGDIVDLMEYSLLNQEKKKIDSFNLYEDVQIEIILGLRKGQRVLNMHFFNQQNQILFIAGTNYDTLINSEGVYKTTFIINKNTFNTGVFRVSIAITCYPGTDVQLHINPAITFKVEESNIELRKMPYTGLIPGEFRPKLKNNTIKLEV